MQVEGSLSSWMAPRIATIREFAAVLGEFVVLLPALAIAPPERQRLTLTELTARVRAIESCSSAFGWAKMSARAIYRLLAQLTKIWWPGSVHPLALRSSPRQALREHHVVARTWREVAQHARVLTGSVAPWADDGALDPRPYALEARFEEVVDRLKIFGGPVYAPLHLTTSNLPRAAYERLNNLYTIAAELRWLRGTVNPILWGAAIGRVRGIARYLKDSDLSEMLAPSFTPGSWMEFLDEDPLLDGLVARRPDEFATDEVLVNWLLELFNAGREFDERVALAEPIGIALARLAPARFCERRLRRQLRKLVAELFKEEGEDIEPDDTTQAMEHVQALPYVAELRPLVEGLRALFVTNRASPEITRELAEHLGLRCEVTVNKVRRRQQVAKRVRSRRYDLVLLAEGFVSHGDSSAIRAACSDVGVPYIPVEKGRISKICRRLYGARTQLEMVARAREEV